MSNSYISKLLPSCINLGIAFVILVATAFATSPIACLKNNDALVTEVISGMLLEKGYHSIEGTLEIQYKPALIIGVINTDQGKKFLKLHDHPEGEYEYNGGNLLDSYIPTIKAESYVYRDGLDLVIQPYVKEIAFEGGMLFDLIWLNEEQPNKLLWPLINDIFSKTCSLIMHTLEYKITPTRNDRLYFARLKSKQDDGDSGRVENFYANSIWNIGEYRIAWNDLLNKHWIIDGIEYKESLRELLNQAKEALNPLKKRCVAISHGDWHDMNMHVYTELERGLSFAFLDCELAGTNEVIGDMMVYLIYSAIQGDYLTPKYSPNQFKERPRSLKIAQNNFSSKKRNIAVQVTSDYITMDGLYNFGTSNTRKKIAQMLINDFFFSIVNTCQKIGTDDVESVLKATLLMRLIAVYNVSTFEHMDQAKIIGLLYKSIGTAVHHVNDSTALSLTLSNFLKAL